MAFVFREFVPVNQYVNPLTAETSVDAETPPIFGSVADNSDATYTEIEGLYDTDPVTPYHTGVLSVDFDTAGTPGTPVAFYVRIRAKSATPDVPVSINAWYGKVGMGDPFDAWRQDGDEGVGISALYAGTQAAIEWSNFAYLNSTVEIDTADPIGGNWYVASADGGVFASNAYDALANTGFALSLWVQSNLASEPRHPYLDIYELRLVVAYEAPGIAPPLRQYPRSDGRATSSARRMWPPSRSYQRGIRRAGGYL